MKMWQLLNILKVYDINADVYLDGCEPLVSVKPVFRSCTPNADVNAVPIDELAVFIGKEDESK